MMKRVFTLFCALVLLLSCFSGMAVSAAEAEGVEIVAEAPAAEEPAEAPAEEPAEAPAEEPAEEPGNEDLVMVENVDVELFPDLRKNESKVRVTGAALEHELSDDFMDYLMQEFAKCPSQINIEKYNIHVSQWKDLTSVIWYETPELFHVISLGYNYYRSSGKIANIFPGYRTHADTAAEYSACLNQMVTNAEYLLRGVKNNTALSDVEKALILHDRLAVWTEYDLENVDSATVDHKIFAAYSALGEGLSVCQGYALAYMYLLEQVGIESDLCSSSELWHSWNIVYIDGQPYYTDVTWDDPTNNWPSDEYFDDYGRVKHTNFMRSYAGIHSNHTAYDYPEVDAPTTYDSGWWWSTSNTSIELFGNLMYYVDNTDGSIYKKDASGAEKVYQHSNPSNGAWVRMSIAGYKLVIGDVWDIKALDLSNGQVTQILKPSECNNGGYIEGVKYENGMLYFQMQYNNRSYRYSYDAFKADSTIVGQPKDTLAAEGKTAKVTVQAVGDGLTYAWYYKKAGAGGFARFSDQQTDTLSLKMTAEWNGAQVYCVVTDAYGKVLQSNTVTLRMSKTVKITQQPKNGAAVNGKTVKITLKASGDGLKYQWYYMKKGESKYTKAGNMTSNTFSVKMSKDWNGTQVYCVVTDKYGKSVKSSVVKLSMSNVVKITTQPTNGVAANGKNAKVTVKASGEGLKYTWYYMKKGASKYTKSSITKNVFTQKMSKGWNGTQVYCVVKDKYGSSVKSSVVKLYVGNPAKIKTQPENASALSGKNVKLTVKASGDGLKYQWYYMKKGESKYTKSSVTKNVFTQKMSKGWNGTKVYCVVKDKYGTSVKSSVVTLKMSEKAKITTQPTNATAQKGKTVKLTLKASGDGLKYQWYYAKKGSSKYKKISGATKATYSVKMSSSMDGRKLYCVVKDKYGNSVKSSVVTLRQFSSISTVAATWKGTTQTLADGDKVSISNVTIKITSKKKVTITAKSAGTGYNKGTYKYNLKYVKISGDTATYKFSNSVETFTVTYSLSKDTLTLKLGSGIKQVYKRA